MYREVLHKILRKQKSLLTCLDVFAFREGFHCISLYLGWRVHWMKSQQEKGKVMNSL